MIYIFVNKKWKTLFDILKNNLEISQWFGNILKFCVKKDALHKI